MFNIVDYPPGLGECSFCKKHTCGIKEDGTQLWLHSPIELHIGNDLTIGYQCAKMIMDGFGLTVEVVEKQVLLTPTNEQIGDYIRNAVNSMPKLTNQMFVDGANALPPADAVYLGKGVRMSRVDFIEKINLMDRVELKNHLAQKEIPFIPQWGEERLREEALKHV